MDDKLLNQIELLDENIHLLEEIQQKTLEEYLHDKILQGAAERYLQIAIETCLNIGNRFALTVSIGAQHQGTKNVC